MLNKIIIFLVLTMMTFALVYSVAAFLAAPVEMSKTFIIVEFWLAIPLIISALIKRTLRR